MSLSSPSSHHQHEYIYYPNPHGVGEDLERYTKHGLYPIEPGQTLIGKHGIYKIIHKLGHGGSSTVWIALNQSHKRLYAIKVGSVYASVAAQHEVHQLNTLSHHQSLASFLPKLVESWCEKSVNCSSGEKHTILISELLGPSLYRLSFGETRLHPHVARSILHKTAQAVTALHEAATVHRDLTPRNIVLKLDDRVRHFPQNSFYKMFGEPVMLPIGRRDSCNPEPQAPHQCVEDINFLQASGYILPEPVLIDLSDSAHANQRPRGRLGTPAPWAAPEVLFENHVSYASDIWSLGCIIYRIRSGDDLFSIDNPANVIGEMFCILGPPPFAHWRAVQLDDMARIIIPSRKLRSHAEIKAVSNMDWINDMNPEDYSSLKEMVYQIYDRPQGARSNPLFWGSGDHCCMDVDPHNKPPSISGQEAELLLDLLSRIFMWDPSKRISAAQVVEHPWFGFDASLQT